MSSQEEEFLKLLRATFQTEAEEHIQAMSSGLLEIEKAADRPARAAVIEKIYREAHSLKGAARAVSQADIEALCQALESVFASWKRGESEPVPAAVAVMLRAVDAASGMLTSEAPVAPESLSALVQDIAAGGAVRQVAAPRKEAAQVPQSVVAEKSTATETVRIPTAKLDALIREVEDFLPMKMAAGQRSEDLRDLEAVIGRWHEQWAAVFPRLRDLQLSMDRQIAPAPADLHHVIDFVEWNQHCLKLLEEKLAALSRTATHDRHEIYKRVDELLDGSRKLAMIPCQTALNGIPKIVRDLCRDRGKETELVVRGGEVEMDKRILDELKDPLIHIVRNCIDHGIETAEQRTAAGKPPRGVISIEVRQMEGNCAEIVVSDDGCGVDLSKLKSAAITTAALSSDEASRMAPQDAINLIFESGVSTSAAVSEISGRGLGLAIVREKTEKLGGHVTVESQPGKGTTLRMVLPLTRATFRGILVQASAHTFVIPTANMERALLLKRDELKTVENRDTISFEGQPVALVRLSDVLGLEPRRGVPEIIPAVVLRRGDRRIAFAVDEVLHEAEVLVKPLGPPLVRVRNIAAATVLGGGQVAAILNITDLLESAAKHHGPATRIETPSHMTESRKASILVVEDSITSRMLLKNILEAAGHRVKTAVDGVDALTTLRTEEFDLVVSDVDMPRMNGLDLTARIRADKRLADKPVILVTALATTEDRERGVQVGANAYIVKSSFDQSNLLAAVERLM